MLTLLNGRNLALSLRHELKNKIQTLEISPRLGVILVGDDPASHLYVTLKEQAAQDVGIKVDKILLPASATTAEVISQIKNFNNNKSVDGVLIQLPLPQSIDEQAVITALNANKDADGFHPKNLALLLNDSAPVIPGASAGIIKLIEQANQSLSGKRALLIVNSQEFALPLKKLLTTKGVAVKTSHEIKKEELALADIIIIALGRPQCLTSEFIKDGTIIIDVGTTKVAGKVLGDVASESFAGRNVYLTPVPGGVGPMTVVMLLWNVYELARRRAQKTV